MGNAPPNTRQDKYRITCLPIGMIIILILTSLLSGCWWDNKKSSNSAKNQIPIANAGADQTANELSLITLDGSASSDPDGSIAKYEWKQTAGTSVTLSDASVAKPTFTAPDVAADETLTFELTVTDDKKASANSTVKVSVKNVVPTSSSISGKALDDALVGAVIHVYAQDGSTLLGTATTAADGSYSVSHPESDTSSFYIVSATGGTLNNSQFLGDMRTICTTADAANCYITPYSSLLVSLAAQYSGDFPSRLAQATAQVAANLGVSSDPFVREAQGQTITDVNLSAWRQALANGAALADWMQAIRADLTDGYLDTIPTPAVFVQAATRPSTPVTESNYTIDKNLVIPVDQAGQTSPLDTLSLPEGTVVTRSLFSLNTGEQGNTITSKDYLSDIAYVETQDFSIITGEADNTVQRIVYQSFNVGKWKGKLDAETTILSRVFMAEPTLLLLPNPEKERVAGILTAQDAFAQAVDLYKKEITGSVDQSQTLLDDLIANLGQTGVEQLDNAQVASSRGTLQAKINAEIPASTAAIPQVAARVASSAATTPQTAAKAATSSDPFKVFQGMWLGYEKDSDQLISYSRSSLWYGIQSDDNFKYAEFWNDIGTTHLLTPKVGLVSAEDVNVFTLFSDDNTPYGTVKSEVDLPSIDSAFANDTQKTVTVFRNNPDRGLDAPDIMNTISWVKIIIKTAGIMPESFLKKLSDGKYVKGIVKGLKAASNLNEKYGDEVMSALALAEVAALVYEETCGDNDDECKEKANLINNNIKIINDFADLIGLGKSEQPTSEIDEETYRHVVIAALSALRPITGAELKSKRSKTILTNRARLKPILLAELVIRPSAKFAGIEMKPVEAYNMARSLFTKDIKARKDFRKLWSEAEKKGFKNKEALVYISFLKNSMSWVKTVSDLIKDPSKVSASDITQKVIEVTLSESKDLISAGLINDLVFKAVKNVTPAKILDIAMTANEGGAMAYDWMTDPSLVRLSMKKEGNTLDIVHSIPDLKAIRYLRVPDAIADNGLVDMSVPNDDLGKMAWDAKNDRLTPLGTTGDVNHFLVMSGFRSSLENQSAYLKVDDDNIEQLMDNKNIHMLWHVKKLGLADEVGKVSQASRTKATAFNNNFEDRVVDDSWLPWADAVVSLDQKNPIHKAVFDGMKAEMSKYLAIDFSEFWKETIGNGADYPLEHKTPGIYSDYTNISFKTDQSAKDFENTVNMYVLPDFTTRQEAVRTDAAVFKSEKLNELQLTFRASSNWSEATSGTLGESGSLWTVLRYAENGKTRWTQPVEITGLPTSGMVTKPFALPEGVNPNTIAVFIYNDTMEAYTRKSGRNILTVLKMADDYRLKSGVNQTPLMYLNVSALKPASKSLLELVDSDGDGLADIWDAFPQDKRYQFDSDKDGMADEWEEQYGLNAYDASDAIADADKDELSNVSEFQHDANPQKGDSDDDGMPDAWEVQYGLDPAVPEDAKTDFDEDGFSNLDEYKNGTNPLEENTLATPQNLKATAGDSKVTLSWDAVTGAANYAYCTSTTQESPDCATYSVSNPLWKDTANVTETISGLINDTPYYFRVVAKTASGKESAVSGEVTATPTAVVLPSPSLSILFNQTGLDALGATGSGYEFITGNNGRPAVKFNGGSILITNRPEIQFTDGATFDMWVRLDSNVGMSGWGYMVADTGWAMALLAKSHDRIGFAYHLAGQDSNYSGSGFGFSYIGTFYDKSWSCGTGATVVNRNPGVKVGEWFRATLSISPATGYKTYVNKQLVYDCSTARPDFSYANTQDLYLGKFSDYWYPFNGAMQDLIIYQKALTDAQVQALP